MVFKQLFTFFKACCSIAQTPMQEHYLSLSVRCLMGMFHPVNRSVVTRNPWLILLIKIYYKIFLEFQVSHMIFSFFNDKRLLAPKYSGATSLEVLRPFTFLIRFSNRMLRPFIFSIRFSDWISLFFPVYKLLF